jgi:peptidoglycan/LPS O-acetylase OafA/YrhL
MVSTPPAPVAPDVVAGAEARTGVRPEIQGLRAIAVMMVVIYHLWPKRLTGGYAGVDVFFAISGFLITAHLLREASRTGTVALRQFWARRARRLLPASLLVLFVSVGATLLWVPQAVWEQFMREAGAAGLYVLNWVLARDAVDYLAADNIASPSQHYWSLSVEEQFYLVWPLLIVLALWLASRVRHGWLAMVGAVLALVTVASFAWSVHLTRADPAAAYFVTPVRAWEFGAGAVLAVVMAAPGMGARLERAPATRALLSWLGLAALVWTAFTYTAATPFPGSAAAVPVLGTLVVIVAGAPASRYSPVRALGTRPVQVLGDISYSTYLWHWPPLVILPFALGRELDAQDKVVLLGAVIAAAWMTKRWVEDPVRTTSRFNLRRPAVTFAWTILAMGLLVGVCVLGTADARAGTRTALAQETQVVQSSGECFGAPSMDPAKTHCPTPELADMVVPDPTRVAGDTAGHGECWVGNDDARLTSCHFPEQGGSADVPHVALVGDSHARQWLSAFIVLAKQGKLTVDTYLKGSCTWSTTMPDRGSEEFSRTCRDWRAALGQRLGEDPAEYDAVVVSGYSRQRIEETPGVDDDTARAEGLIAAWGPALDAGVPIVAIRDNPIPGEDPNQCLRTRGKADPSRCDIARSKALSIPDPQVAAAEHFDAQVPLIDLTDLYCDRQTCPAVVGGANVYRDRHHATSTYIKTLTPYMWAQLEPAITRD